MSGMTNPNGETELLPCPFCGSRNLKLFPAKDDADAAIECLDCIPGSVIVEHTSDAEAIARWNTRPQTGRER